MHPLRTSGAVVPARTAASSNASQRKARPPSLHGDHASETSFATTEAAGVSGETDGFQRRKSLPPAASAWGSASGPSEGVGKVAQQKWMMSMLIQQQQEQMKTMNGQMAVMREMCESNLQMMRQILDNPVSGQDT